MERVKRWFGRGVDEVNRGGLGKRKEKEVGPLLRGEKRGKKYMEGKYSWDSQEGGRRSGFWHCCIKVKTYGVYSEEKLSYDQWNQDANDFAGS